MINRIWIQIFLMVMLTGCAIQPVATLEQNDPTETLTPTPEKTVTATATHRPRNTPFPTVSVEDSLAWLDEYCSREDACEFTCWLGITPGITTFAEAEAILQQVAIRIELDQNRYGKHYDVTLPDWKNENQSASMYVRNDQVVEAIYTWIYPPNLQDFLDWESEPDEVWVHFEQVSQTGDVLFYLVSISSQEDYAVFYYDEFAPWIETQDGLAVQICTSTLFKNPPKLIMWDPNEDYSVRDIASHIFFDHVPLFKELEAISDLNAGDFYERFRSVDGNACIEIPYTIQ